MSLAQIIQDLETAAVAGDLPLAPRAENIVPGEGSPTAEILLIGEAPGFHESVEHRPFVGVSGKLLRKTLTEAGFPPESVFISNIIKARPPENRDPTPEEIAAYKPFLDREIDLINPKLIVTLGRFSMAKFLSEVKISQVHGRLHKVVWAGQNRFILPMYHPAAALRSTQMKTAFISDFEKLPKIMAWLKDQSEIQTFAKIVKAQLL
ncbi:MAG TPA: uracil-DNA glycosylase [Candidatus Pacebacteria bacterium]|nr:uracil-DNA glycosylase [Candidatus Paceibacterota bacterium]